MEKIEEVKALLASKTVWGAIVGFCTTLAALFLDVDVSAEDQAKYIEACVVLGGGIGAFVLTVYGRLTAKKKVNITGDDKAMVALVIGPIIALSVVGCATTDGRKVTDLTPLEQASLYGVETERLYTHLHTTYTEHYATASPEVQDAMAANIAPKLNKAKHALILYLDSVRQWAYLREPPMDVGKRQEVLAETIRDAMIAVQKLVQ